MDYVTSVILISVFKRQVYNVIENESERKGEHEKSGFCVIILYGDVQSDDNPVNNRERYVGTTDHTIFEFLFKLPILIFR